MKISIKVDAITFAESGDFAASGAASAWLDARGFTMGSMQSDYPRAIWHGDCYVSKWRGLSESEKRSMHAVATGDMRHGPVTIKLCPGATPEAIAAFRAPDAPPAAVRAMGEQS